MWTCQICDAEVEEESWDLCWKCSHPRTTPPEEVETLRALQDRKKGGGLNCIRCNSTSKYAGTKSFHEGSNLGFLLGDFGHLFEGSERYDVYVCISCGKVEFYVDGIGDAARGEQA